MGWDEFAAAILSQKGRILPIAQFKEYQEAYRELSLQVSPWPWEPNYLETIILLPLFAIRWQMLNDGTSHSATDRTP